LYNCEKTENIVAARRYANSFAEHGTLYLELRAHTGNSVVIFIIWRLH